MDKTNKTQKTRKVRVLPATENLRSSHIIENARSNRRYVGNGGWVVSSEYTACEY